MNVLVVNAGSSSLRLRLLDGDDAVVAETDLDWVGELDEEAVERFVRDLPEPVDAIGHRVVHGGDRFTEATIVADAVIDAIEALTPLAPLHQPRAVEALRLSRSMLPSIPDVACFDTAFHSSIGPPASTYALPEEWRTTWGLRRFGFHGLSHRYATGRARQMAGPGRTTGRVVTCHLGAGASLCATVDGVSVDTTMGFTPNDGLVMATRSGAVDPGLLLWLVTDAGVDVARVARAIGHESGLLGLGGTSDMREILARRAIGDERAALAFDVYVHRLTTSIGAMAVSAGGLDVLVFTGGVGEHEPLVRAEAAGRLGHLGVAVDHERNAAATDGVDADVTGTRSSVAVLVVAAREDLEIAREVRAAITGARAA